MTTFGVTFARGGSKGVPGKNLRTVGGQSLLELAVTLGLSMASIDRMLCSTDSAEIRAEAIKFGAEVPTLRPAELAQDDSPEWAAWQHCALHLIRDGAQENDLMVSLPATSPLREERDVQQAIDVFRAGAFDLVLGVCESSTSPWFNMVVRESQGEVVLVSTSGLGEIVRRQDAPTVFDVTTVVYVTTLGFVLGAPGIFAGMVGSVIVPRERALDIDTELDLDVANFLARRNKER